MEECSLHLEGIAICGVQKLDCGKQNNFPFPKIVPIQSLEPINMLDSKGGLKCKMGL